MGEGYTKRWKIFYVRKSKMMFRRYGKFLCLIFFVSTISFAQVNIDLQSISKSVNLPQTERFKQALNIVEYQKADAYMIWTDRLKSDLGDYEHDTVLQKQVYEQLIWLIKNILKEYKFKNSEHPNLLIRLSGGVDKEHFCLGLSFDAIAKLENRDFAQRDVAYAKSNKLPLLMPLKNIIKEVKVYKSCMPLNLKIDRQKTKVFSSIASKYWFSSDELFIEDAYERYEKTRQKIFDYLLFGDINGVKRYISYGFSLNKKDKDGYTLLSTAAANGNMDIVRLLLKAGVDVNQKNSDGTTPLIQATLSNEVDIVKFLVEQGADANIYPSGFENAYMAAKRKGYNTIASYLKPLTKKLSDVPTKRSSTEVGFVSVEAKFTRGLLNASLAKNLQMSPVDPDAFIGEFQPSFSQASTGAIYKGINGIAGYYNYSFQSDDDSISCSGQIYVSGKKQGLHLNVREDCSDAGSFEY